MRRFLKAIKSLSFLLALIAVFAIADPILTRLNPIKDSSLFYKNDFEVTQAAHPEKVWDKVLFGNSVVISGYDEAASVSGYVNLGVDYGVITDLVDMLEKGYVRIGSELVLGLNYFCFYDDFETNATYMWHKKWYEPYVYFERDRFYPFLTGGLESALRGGPFVTGDYSEQGKLLYYGAMSGDELGGQIGRHSEKFWSLGLESFSENLAALDGLLAYCGENGIRVRALWLPWNPVWEVPQIELDVEAEAEKVFEKYGVEALDLKNSFGTEYFYDLSHLNVEAGRPMFTEVFDGWAQR